MKFNLLSILWEINSLLGKGLGNNTKNTWNLEGADQKMFRTWFDPKNVNSAEPTLPTGRTAQIIAGKLWDKISPPDSRNLNADALITRDKLKTDILAIIKSRVSDAQCNDFNKERFGAWFSILAEKERKIVKHLKGKSSRRSSTQSVVQFMPMSYNEANIYGDDWREGRRIVSLSMVALSGGIFRNERLAWQRRLQDFPKNTFVSGEPQSEWERRIDREVGGDDIEEPWTNALHEIRIFFGRTEWFEEWREAGNGLIEEQEASRRFWVLYLQKLRRKYSNLQNAELYEIRNPGFYAHVKTYDGHNSGHIIGCNLFAAKDFPNAFEVWWPPKANKPAAFEVVEKSIERIGGAIARERVSI